MGLGVLCSCLGGDGGWHFASCSIGLYIHVFSSYPPPSSPFGPSSFKAKEIRIFRR